MWLVKAHTSQEDTHFYKWELFTIKTFTTLKEYTKIENKIVEILVIDEIPKEEIENLMKSCNMVKINKVEKEVKMKVIFLDMDGVVNTVNKDRYSLGLRLTYDYDNYKDNFQFDTRILINFIKLLKFYKIIEIL